VARRSPTNKRYQKDTKVGSTRRSASSAKPKKSNAGPAASSSSAKKSSTSSSSRYQAIVLPPEIKRLQKISFALLGVAVAISILYLWKGKVWGANGSIVLGLAYACMFGALYLDFAKIRPVQKAIRAGKMASATVAAKSSAKPVAASVTELPEGDETETSWLKRLWKPKSEKSDEKNATAENPDAKNAGDEGN
jgi:hypothetical protein